MIGAFFPMKKLRRHGKYVLFGAALLIGLVAVYHEIVAAKAWSDTGLNFDTGSNWRRAMFDQKVKRGHQPDSVPDSAAWISSYNPQSWKPEFKGKANLHVFEDWCGSSTADLRENLHYPLYPHSKTTVQKLAVSPQWINYGLRIFGYIHPYADGDFVFAVSSDDNSELWLSTDDSPVNLQLMACVGESGKEWTAPGEFEKYASQTSKPVRLSAQKRYFFEVIHKQNDRGTDHVEVAWQLLDHGFRFTVIESKYISLYADESALLMSDVAHIPQTAASHKKAPTKRHSAAADMLRDDPRDTFYKVPLINGKFIQGVLPDCLYKPSYTIRNFVLQRYQGLEFIHISYVYPNDYTRLTHMEDEDSCFYPNARYYRRMSGFSRYMTFDQPGMQNKGNQGFGFQKKRSAHRENSFDQADWRDAEARLKQPDNALFPDYGDDYDDYVQRRRRKLFSLVPHETIGALNSTHTGSSTEKLQNGQKRASVQMKALNHLQHNRTEFKQEASVRNVKPVKQKGSGRLAKRHKMKSSGRSVDTNAQVLAGKEQLEAKQQPADGLEKLDSKQNMIQRNQKRNQTQIQTTTDFPLPKTNGDVSPAKEHIFPYQQRLVTRQMESNLHNARHFTAPQREAKNFKVRSKKSETDPRKGPKVIVNRNRTDKKFHVLNRAGRRRVSLRDEQATFSPPTAETSPLVFDTQVNWNQTFQVTQQNLQGWRSDMIDLRCNISGNLLLSSSDALPIVETFMEHLNTQHNGRFTLMRVINVEKRPDGAQGSRYLLELELKDANGQLLRLAQYIYALIRHSRQHSRDFNFMLSKPQLVQCNPVGFRWNPDAMVHFVVPVKNQARWVQQLINDMEQLFRETGDTNFNLIITDYSSTDMDVRKALQKSSLPRYQYVKLSGNFERSAGLQAGIDQINDDHSIVFLCDLHIVFPPSIIDTIRKHCVEGYMAFAPIVLRLGCGVTPFEARGYWEVNGFGLLGIYKSDLIAVGGMNTMEYKDRWGGEDWELLDRILQRGLEVERIYLRNFFHHHHSKRGMWNRRMSANRK
ncbi:beta-1,4-N-acetylgalactosaminyltransferase 3 [Menidia menidia]